MTVSSNPRIALHAPSSETTSVRTIRRWALVRLILGFLQMFGAAFSLGLIVYSGITPIALTSVIVTGAFTGTSILLFQVGKRRQPPGGQSAIGNRTR
jgi:hypothetical protein